MSRIAEALDYKTVELTDAEVELCRRVADVRNSKNGLVPNHRYGRDKDWNIHFIGMLGELAVCKVCDYPIDRHFSYHGDNGQPDLYCGDLSVEVKTVRHLPPILKLNHLDDFTSDAVVLCYVDMENPHKVLIAGCVSRPRFEGECYMRDFGYGNRFCFDGDNMKGIDTLLRFAKA